MNSYWCIQYDPPGGPSVIEDYDTEALADARAHELVNGSRFQRVVIFEIADRGDAA